MCSWHIPLEQTAYKSTLRILIFTVHTRLWSRSMGERDHLDDLAVDEKIILRLIFKKQDGGMNWTDLAHDRGRWQALVYAVKYSRIQ